MVVHCATSSAAVCSELLTHEGAHDSQIVQSSADFRKIIDIIIVNNNVSDPKIDPRGTPLFIGNEYHCSSSNLTDCLQLVEYYCCELHSNGSWLSHWSVCV